MEGKAISCPPPISMNMLCEISCLKDSADLIGKSCVLISYFGHHSTPSHMHSGHLEKSVPNFQAVLYLFALKLFTYWHCSSYLGAV